MQKLKISGFIREALLAITFVLIGLVVGWTGRGISTDLSNAHKKGDIGYLHFCLKQMINEGDAKAALGLVERLSFLEDGKAYSDHQTEAKSARQFVWDWEVRNGSSKLPTDETK